MTLILAGEDGSIAIEDILLDGIEEHFENVTSSFVECSSLVVAPPPRRKRCTATGTRLFIFIFRYFLFTDSKYLHSARFRKKILTFKNFKNLFGLCRRAGGFNLLSEMGY